MTKKRLSLSGYLTLLPLAAALGCGEARPQTPPPAVPPPPTAVNRFDSATAGTISGHVTWTGALPVIPPFEARAFIPTGQKGKPRLIRPNPNAPRIDPTTRGVAGAVVFLRGIPAGKARLWDHAPVRVEQLDRRLHVMQGSSDVRVGFVRVGDDVEMVSRDDQYHSLHADGAAFFTLTFPDKDRPRQRRLPSPGVVELSSAAGYYWMRAYLFVDEHPYYTRTDAQGRFRLDGVPPGRYEIVCWHPSWVERSHDRDPETSLVNRVFFRPPVEQRRQIEIGPRANAAAEFTLSAADFAK